MGFRFFNFMGIAILGGSLATSYAQGSADENCKSVLKKESVEISDSHEEIKNSPNRTRELLQKLRKLMLNGGSLQEEKNLEQAVRVQEDLAAEYMTKDFGQFQDLARSVLAQINEARDALTTTEKAKIFYSMLEENPHLAGNRYSVAQLDRAYENFLQRHSARVSTLSEDLHGLKPEAAHRARCFLGWAYSYLKDQVSNFSEVSRFVQNLNEKSREAAQEFVEHSEEFSPSALERNLLHAYSFNSILWGNRDEILRELKSFPAYLLETPLDPPNLSPIQFALIHAPREVSEIMRQEFEAKGRGF